MRFWRITPPFGEERFAEAMSRRASMSRAGLDWSTPHAIEEHDIEERSDRRRYPMVLEWAPGSDEVAEFTWPQVGLVVWRSVAEELAATSTGVEIHEVEMHQDPKLAPPVRVTRRTKSRVWLPYTGPELAELAVTRFAEIDLGASDVEIRENACQCGYCYWKPLGVDRWGMVRGADGQERHGRLPRDGIRGLRVPAEQLQGAGFFRLVGRYRDWILVTDEVKDHVESRGWRNVEFVEIGDIIGH